jgi:hypothetical protein
MSDRDWLAPSIVLTLLSGTLAFLLIPNYAGIMPALLMLPFWLIAAAIIGSVYGFFGMVSAGVRRPFAHVVQEWPTIRRSGVCVLVAGLNMTTFMWIKPLLNYLVPFWADPLLADADHMLFLGHEPWALFTWLNSSPAAIFYHRGWFAMMLLTLLVVSKAPPSAEKSAMMLSYFTLWSVVGPLIHALLPAAGPVFFAQMGYGDRFAGLHGSPETQHLTDYLWAVYSGTGFGPGSGISAMPSMHIATTAWMIIGFYVLARRWIAPMAIAGLLIFLLSISLGWHYAMDGIVGATSAVLCYLLFRSFYRRRFPDPSLSGELPGKPA